MDATTEQTDEDKLNWAKYLGIEPCSLSERGTDYYPATEEEMEFNPPHVFTGTTQQLLALRNR
jgi:hypothetical protein